MLNVAYVLLASLCTFLGVAGYWMYGSNVLDIITFNLPAVSNSVTGLYAALMVRSISSG